MAALSRKTLKKMIVFAVFGENDPVR